MGWQKRSSDIIYESSNGHALIIGGRSKGSSIPRTAISVMLRKREEKKQKNMSVQRTSREDQKVWRLLQF